jgi:3-oxoacyl-[acyl-carrier-protein] synthase II
MGQNNGRRVVITGMGLVTPIGNTVDACWSNVEKGQSGFSPIPALVEASWGDEKSPVTLGGVVQGFDPDIAIGHKEARRMDPFIQYALTAAHEAWAAAGLPDKLSNEEGDRAATLVGVGLAGVGHILDVQSTIRERGPRRVSPFFIPSVIGNLAPGYIGMRYNLRNANWTPASAGASGAHGVGEGYRHIVEGRADLVVAGGAEAVLTPLVVLGFHAMGALTAEQDATRAVRPFDAKRDGTLLGEGAGVLVLEEMGRAQARGAKILCEIVGYGTAHDGPNIGFDPSGDGARVAIQNAFDGSGLDKEQVGYINANGTGSVHGDRIETAVYKDIFGAHAKKLAVSSTKSMTGEMLAASGAVESVFAALAVTKGFLPPTAHLENPGEGCDLDYVPGVGRKASVEASLSYTYGTGGTNTALLFRAV